MRQHVCSRNFCFTPVEANLPMCPMGIGRMVSAAEHLFNEASNPTYTNGFDGSKIILVYTGADMYVVTAAWCEKGDDPNVFVAFPITRSYKRWQDLLCDMLACALAPTMAL